MQYSAQTIVDLFNWNIVKVHGNEVSLSDGFKSWLSDNVRLYRDRFGVGDDGPAIVQTIKEMSGRKLTREEIFQYLNVVVPLVKTEMDAYLVERKGFSIHKGIR